MAERLRISPVVVFFAGALVGFTLGPRAFAVLLPLLERKAERTVKDAAQRLLESLGTRIA